jgi:SAM-dependent methyltransferase
MSDGGHGYTHGHHESVLRSHRWRTAANSAAYLLPALRAGQAVLDVGCGPGTITLDLAARVAPGRVLGIDAAPEVVDEARAAAASAGFANVDFEVADVYALDLADRSFDVVHAHQLLQHLSDPVAALRELRRVCAPNGVVAARDADYEAMTWWPEHPGIDRWRELYRATARADGAEPDAGRRLLAWANEAGYSRVDAGASTWCFVTPEDRAWWSASWAQRVRDSRFAEHALAHGLTSVDELSDIATAWMEWGARDDAWFAVLHGEVVCRP